LDVVRVIAAILGAAGLCVGPAAAQQVPANVEALGYALSTCMNHGASAKARVAACNAIYKVTVGGASQAAILWYRTEARVFAGDAAGAIADADAAAKLLPNNADMLNAKCWSRAVANRELDAARAACNKSLEMDRSPAALDSRGLLGLRQGRWREAWADYNAAVAANPSLTGSVYGRGLAALAMGRIAEGEADLAKAASAAAEYGRYGLTPEMIKAKARTG
jgi:tetratricopeptide (TPR) repeat protein